MVTYFAASSDEDALAAADTPPAEDETFESSIDPDGLAFSVLLQLITGKDPNELDAEAGTSSLEVADPPRLLTRFGTTLCATVADMDEATFQALAQPWRRDESIGDSDVDLVDFLTNFQHLCRRANDGGGAYALGPGTTR